MKEVKVLPEEEMSLSYVTRQLNKSWLFGLIRLEHRVIDELPGRGFISGDTLDRFYSETTLRIFFTKFYFSHRSHTPDVFHPMVLKWSWPELGLFKQINTINKKYTRKEWLE